MVAPSDCEQRVKFLGLTGRDGELLRALRPLLEQHIGAIEDEFYEHLLGNPETAQLLRDRTTVERLKKMQRDYLLRITDGVFDETYFADRLRIGKTHERVGLSPCWYLLAYRKYGEIIAPLIRAFYPADHARAHDSISALEKVFMLDASLALDAYIAGDRFRRAQQLENIVDHSADVIFMVDTELRFRTWNRAAEQVFGWRAEEILGQPVNVIAPVELVGAAEWDRIERELKKRGHFHFESLRRAKDGRSVPVEITVSVLTDPHGQALGRSVILRDITERRRLEESKLQAERLAVIGAMSARLAHEIRNPLSSITLNLDLTRDEIDGLAHATPAAGTEARALLRSIDAELQRILRVVEDYLRFARMPKLRRGRVALNELLEQQFAFMKPLFDAARVTLSADLGARLPTVQADAEQLWEAILNLVRNGLEAMPDGGTLTVRTALAGDEVELIIADTGKGIAAADIPEIFRPFFSTKSSGTGLGLPLAQQIFTEHGGRIECTSELGRGTTFTIHLPQAGGT